MEHGSSDARMKFMTTWIIFWCSSASDFTNSTQAFSYNNACLEYVTHYKERKGKGAFY
jgi:hypothetical protein